MHLNHENQDEWMQLMRYNASKAEADRREQQELIRKRMVIEAKAAEQAEKDRQQDREQAENDRKEQQELIKKRLDAEAEMVLRDLNEKKSDAEKLFPESLIAQTLNRVENSPSKCLLEILLSSFASYSGQPTAISTRLGLHSNDPRFRLVSKSIQDSVVDVVLAAVKQIGQVSGDTKFRILAAQRMKKTTGKLRKEQFLVQAMEFARGVCVC